MNKQEESEFLDQLAIDLIECGMDKQVTIKAMRVPDKIWINWRDDTMCISGTAQIDRGVASGDHGSTLDCAELFIDYIIQQVELQTY